VKEKKEIIAWNPPVEWIRDAIEQAGTTIGSVHFNKRSSGKLRKMSYRLHVTNPSTAQKPKEIKRKCFRCVSFCSIPIKRSKKIIDSDNDQITVLDANKVVRDGNGNVIGRGAWRTIPLENVTRISNRGTTYTINRF
jgi:hypothetical protein